MTLGQMRVLIPYAEDRIKNFAGTNDAFDRDRAAWHESLVIEEADLGVGLTAFAFKLRTEFHTVVLNGRNEVVHNECDRKR